MQWQNVLLIWQRELRDQLRDRRTLFMVAVLPVLMYPLLGTSLFQLAQFMRETTGRVAIYGAEELEAIEGLPPLLDGNAFATELLDSPTDAKRLEVELRTVPADQRQALAEEAIAADEIDVAICFPEGFAERLQQGIAGGEEEARAGPSPKAALRYDTTREASQVARMRVFDLMRRWEQAVVRTNLAASNVPIAATSPFSVDGQDVAPQESRDAHLWSKLLPFIVFLWALTGAFYPAIDLCAGEKERGTLETLLASPARRSEIVGGKLLTVMTFSVFTALLNLASLSMTARVLTNQLAGFTGASLNPPPMSALLWLVVAVVPMAAFFSALSLACAAYARSTKEGQYYFMPLFLGAMPLMLLPLSPGVQLNLGNSLVPVMGLVLLLGALIEGQLAEAALYTAPVMFVTAICCWLAMRWAVSQFNQESVLFRESERFDLRGQVRAMFRRRGATPSAAAAMACIAGIFLMQTLVRSLTPPPVAGQSGLGYFAASVVSGQVLCILLPAIVIAWLLSRDRLKTFLLDRMPRPTDVALGAGLAVCLHPVGQRLALGIRELYPLSEAVEAQLGGLMQLVGGAPPIGVILLLLAVLPAICEEIAFRGVILAGLRKSLGDNGGILMSAVLFGATHTILQQSLAAAPVGAILGVIAIRTGSLIPCVVFHAAYNSLQLLSALYAESIRSVAAGWGLPDAVFTEMRSGELGYAAPIGILGGVVAIGLLKAMGRRGRGNPHVAARLETAS